MSHEHSVQAAEKASSVPRWLQPPRPAEQLPDDQVTARYPRLRLQVFLGIITNSLLLAYGFSKFLTAILSDRSNARLFLPIGLVLSAAANMFPAAPRPSRSPWPCSPW